MSLFIGARFPNIEVNTTHGKFKLHDFQGDSWLIFMSHHADYTPVCTSELGRAAELTEDFTRRNAKLIALSCDSIEDHATWEGDVMALIKDGSSKLPFPIIEDVSRRLTTKFGMIDADAKDEKGRPLTARALFIVDPQKILRFYIMYPGSMGRNFDEVLRALDALQLVTKETVITPAEWRPGDRVIIPASANSSDYANPVETVDLPSGKDYMRFTTV